MDLRIDSLNTTQACVMMALAPKISLVELNRF